MTDRTYEAVIALACLLGILALVRWG